MTNLLIDQNRRVVFVGLVCVDLFQVLPRYPAEDLGHRCLDSYWQRGGNASNSATVLSILGGRAEFFGTLSDDRELSFIQRDFQESNINFHNSVIKENTSCPISVVIISQESHTRTVLHTNKNLPELTLEDFKQKIDLDSNMYGWVHFEGRDNACEIAKMLRYLIEYNAEKKVCDDSFKPIISSLEAEKLRFSAGLEMYDMWGLPDVMFVSKDFAKNDGFTSMTEAVCGYFPRLKKGAILICAWGDEGAAAISSETGVITSPAFKPPAVVDTCGAGDTFNAATIHALSQGKNLETSIKFACKVAGAKCGIHGFNDLGGKLSTYKIYIKDKKGESSFK